MSAPLSYGNRQNGRQKLNGHFSVMQRADDPDIARAARQLKEDLKGGANGIAVIFQGAHNAYGFGLPPQAETMERLFDGVDLADLHIRIDNHPHGQNLTEKCVEFLQKRRIDPRRAKISFGIDPIVNLATTGRLKMSIAALKASLPQSMSAFFSSGLPGVVLEADGRPFHNAGASPAQEIGAILSIARNHLQMVEEGRHHVAYALPHIGFATALDQNPAQNLAKLQVLQMLWHKLQGEYGIGSPFSAQIHVETSMRMMTKRGCLTNIARAAAASLAAIAGKAASLSVLPYSLPLGLPDSSARREARNIPLIFIRETAPDELISGNALAPNAALVEILAAAAWEEFQLFEKQGGILQSLLDGSLIRRLNEAQDLSVAAYVKGERGIIGASLFRAAEREAEEPSGIYAQKPITLPAEGVEHCKPLSFRRAETAYEEAIANAPSDAR